MVILIIGHFRRKQQSITCMSSINLPQQSSLTPIYSPRTSLSRINAEMDKLTTNMAINIDKYILGFFKDAFEQNNNELPFNQFMTQGTRHLKSWQRELQYRTEKMQQCLSRLFAEADTGRHGVITWNQFNSMLIEKGLNLKSLRNQQPGNTALMKPVTSIGFSVKHNSPIQKMVSLGTKMAMFTEESNQIDFYNVDGSATNLKPLILSQQSLTVQTSMTKRNKAGSKQILKKDIVVAEYKNVLLDMIYVNDSKYNMLITSSSDFMIKGWDISSNIPALAKQPENEDQKMQHQFQIQIHTMAWDNVNEVLYCCGKTPKIYEWMVKTDSERQLYDPDGHTEMISAMIMMPKLQFLATGGYDGKLILWDTISQTKKFKYKQHTRSISSMAFHQGLILLFTAAYDHSICVWNPYIQSLIHKIIGNINFIYLEIIPETNLLLALDAESNVKIRQINKFSLVSSFSIDKHEHRVEPTYVISTNNPLRYYFAGLSVAVYEYVHIDANIIQDSTALCLKYHPESFMLYCPIKNHLVSWDLLSGNIANTLRNQTSSEITAFDIMRNLKFAIIGDLQGNIAIRKLQNGVLVKKLHKHKTTVTYILAIELLSQNIIFSTSYDGQIAVFQRDSNGDFNNTRSLSTKKLCPQANVTSLSYQNKRNTLIIGTNIGEVYFLDIDKNKMISKCETHAGEIEQFVQLEEENILLSFSKKAEIFGLYLPPHLKKFKPSCHLVSEVASAKISSVVMSVKNKRCFIGFENGDMMCFLLNYDTISDGKREQSENTQLIRHIWKNNFADPIRNLILIENEDVLVAIIGANKVIIIACENGSQVAELNERYSETEPTPILYFNEQKNEVYVKSQDVSLPIKTTSKEDAVRRVFDPAYYLKTIEPLKKKINTVSNPQWKFNPKIQKVINANIAKTLEQINDIDEYEKQPKKFVLVKAQSQPSFDLSKAIQIQKRWERQKQEQDLGRTTSKQQSLHHTSSANFLNSSKIGNKSLFKDVKNKPSNSTLNTQNTSPLYRLGMALMTLNEKDNKAQKLVEMAQKQYLKSKNHVKLPKLNPKQID